MLFQTRYEVVPNVRKIAVMRANQLGDFIFSLPALEALQATYTQAEIVLLGRKWHADFLKHRPGPVDRVAAIPPVWDNRVGLGDKESDPDLDRFFEELRQEHFDLALQMHGGGLNSNPFILNLGARFTAGLSTPDAAPLDRSTPYIYYQSEIMRLLEVVALVGANETPSLEPRLSVTQADLTESLEVVPDRDRPLVALHPGATDPRRHWPAEKFALTGDALAKAGARVVVTGTGPERALVERVIGAMECPAQNLCDQLSLNGLVGLLSRCKVLVTNDSGPLHLAMAVGAATVGIYWCGNLINAGPLTRARHRPALSWRLDCPECGVDCTKVRCAHTASFVADVPAEEVIESALDLLKTA
jgi:ADP-heptose:LPS heptosyltransferase